jgi:hypothetical protein
MEDAPPNLPESAEAEKLRLAKPQPLPLGSPSQPRTRPAETQAREKLRARGFQFKETQPKIEVQPRSIKWAPIAVALVIALLAAAGLWRWRDATPPKVQAVETPLEYHKREFLAALRGGGTNPVPMQVRADRMRFHQKALLSHGFLAEKKFVFTNGAAAKARVAINRIDGVSMEYAIVEPRGRDALVVIAPQDDMPVWESVMRLAGGK